MTERAGDAVRVVGRGNSGTPAPPGRGIAVVVIIVLIAGLITLLASPQTNERSAAITVSDLASETLPSSSTMLDRTPVVTATRPPTALYLASSATISSVGGLAEFAPQWEGTLHLTVGRIDGAWEISEWTAPSPGLRLLTLTDRPHDLPIDPDTASVRVETEPDPYRVFRDVLGYAWHQTDPGRIAWLSRGDDGTVDLHEATALEDGVHFGQVQDLEWLAISDDGTLDLTAFGHWGFLVERWTIDDDRRRVEVFALDPGGELLRKEGECRFWLQFADCSGFWPIG